MSNITATTTAGMMMATPLDLKYLATKKEKGGWKNSTVTIDTEKHNMAGMN